MEAYAAKVAGEDERGGSVVVLGGDGGGGGDGLGKEEILLSS